MEEAKRGIQMSGYLQNLHIHHAGDVERRNKNQWQTCLRRIHEGTSQFYNQSIDRSINLTYGTKQMKQIELRRTGVEDADHRGVGDGHVEAARPGRRRRPPSAIHRQAYFSSTFNR